MIELEGVAILETVMMPRIETFSGKREIVAAIKQEFLGQDTKRFGAVVSLSSCFVLLPFLAKNNIINNFISDFSDSIWEFGCFLGNDVSFIFVVFPGTTKFLR